MHLARLVSAARIEDGVEGVDAKAVRKVGDVRVPLRGAQAGSVEKHDGRPIRRAARDRVRGAKPRFDQDRFVTDRPEIGEHAVIRSEIVGAPGLADESGQMSLHPPPRSLDS
jgi:hypothetical protein